MKKITICFAFILLLSAFSVQAQCDAAFLAFATPQPVDNSGNTINFIAMFNNEYTTLSGLNINDTYTLSNPNTTLFLTLRDVNDNSVIASGNTPLTFTATVTQLEVHLFISSSCPTTDPNGLFYPIAATNETALGINDYVIDKFMIFPNPSNGIIKIKTAVNISNIDIITVSGMLKNNVEITKNEINISNFESGMYFLKIITHDGKEIIKTILKN